MLDRDSDVEIVLRTEKAADRAITKTMWMKPPAT